MMTFKKMWYTGTALLLAVAPIIIAPHFAFADATQFDNPLRFQTIDDFVQGILQAFVYIALPIVAFFMVYAGFKFIAAQGNQTKMAEAKNNFVHVVIGASLVLGAWALAMLIKGTIDQITS